MIKFYLKEYSSHRPKGCVLKVDFEYPKYFHPLHNDYLLNPNKIEIKENILSNESLYYFF